MPAYPSGLQCNSNGLTSLGRYLIQRIEENPNIEMHYQTEIVGLDGDTHLQKVTWKDKTTGETSIHDIQYVFIMAGASPRTDWLEGCLELDSKGFILTGRDLDDVIVRFVVGSPAHRAPV